MLQKILLEYLGDSGTFPHLAETAFPLSHLAPTVDVSYTSAIAPMIQAQQSQDVVRLASRLRTILQPYFRDNTRCSELGQSAIAQDLQIQVNNQGWLIFTLSEAGLSSWLDQISAVELLGLVATINSQPSSSLPSNLPCPLCDQLQLSLPMLLIWAYTRSATLLSALPPLSQTSQLISPTPLQQTPSWTFHSPLPCHRLLKSSIHAIDHLAAKPGNNKVMLRQGAALAAAIYDFDAAVPTATINGQPIHHQVAIVKTLRAAQTLLALVILELFGIEPLPSL